ncbi:MAG TPA: phenylalanine--tRNA ligase beta subunit-related protein [Candidatus Azoamicus sp.]
MKIHIKALYYLLGKKINIQKLIEKLNILGFESNLIENYLDIAIPYNRSDCNNLISILNEIKNFDKKFSINLLKNETHDVKKKSYIKVKISDKSFCPIYSYAILDNINIKKNIPTYIKETLQLNDINSVNNLIDIINYATIITGQPFHSYDLSMLNNEINIFKTTESCIFYSINNLKIKIPENIFIIKSKKEIISIPGIIGSLNSKVSENTKIILLESAFFDSDAINYMTEKLKILTDSSQRFINKIDYKLTVKSLIFVTDLISKILKSKKTHINVKIKKIYLPKDNQICVKKNFFLNLLSNNISNNSFNTYINNVFLKKREFKKNIIFNIPNNRKDLEIKENVFSEIVKLYGYNNIVPTKLKNTFFKKEVENDVTYNISYFLKSIGFNEIISYSFVDFEIEKFFNDKKNFIYIKNPISEKMNVMRRTLTQGLIKSAKFNINRQNVKLNLFEIGNVYEKYAVNKFHTENVLSLIVTDKINNYDTFFNIKNIINRLLKIAFNIDEIDLIESNYSFLNQKINLSITLDSKEIGYIGMIKKNILNVFELKQEFYTFSLFLDRINNNFFKKIEEISKYPYSIRDLSIIIKANIKYKDIIIFIKSLKITDLIKISFLDFYDITEIDKSLTLRFKFGSKIRTLLDNDVSNSMNIVQNNLKIKFNINIRT